MGDKCSDGSSLFGNTLQLWGFSCLGYPEFPNHVLSWLYVEPCMGRLPTLLAVCQGTFPALFEEKGHIGGSVAFLY